MIKAIMNPFDLLPDEKIVEICEFLDEKTLGRMIQTCGKMYQLCSLMLLQRKLKLIKEIEKIDGYLKVLSAGNYAFIEFLTDKLEILNSDRIHLTFTKFPRDHIFIEQSFILYSPPIGYKQIISSIPWINPDMSYEEKFDFNKTSSIFVSRAIMTNDETNIRKTLFKIEKLGYKMRSVRLAKNDEKR